MGVLQTNSSLRLPTALSLLCALLVCCPAVGQSDDESRAQLHLKIARAALDKEDFDVAAEELRTAINYAPKNATLYYNLAFVQAKQKAFPDARQSLNHAIRLGIPEDLKEKATDLLATVTYELNSKARKVFQPYLGTWHGQNEEEKRYRYSDLACANTVRYRVTLTLKMDQETGSLDGDFHLEQTVTSQGCPANLIVLPDAKDGSYSFPISVDMPTHPDTTGESREFFAFKDRNKSSFHGKIVNHPKWKYPSICYDLPGAPDGSGVCIEIVR
jgi:tetratricopeptide (TPR) repeat protein